ncbi:TenA family protein [Rhizobium sp. KVB221]|uniref:TenA family protein n=1 Tax=Rhizobium setariae TaxID=2801340 RepID=A0A936YV52_9HYPH|nr:TenA family protein [Rhizobium setariae]MBL0373752.1 TenA family protein [Rhizobium setariae]
MITANFDFGLFGRLRAAAGADWTDYVNHPFVGQLGRGTLPQACFRRFLTQDYLFLIHYARAYALLAHKSTTLADIRMATATLDAIVQELPLHLKYCAGWGLTEAMIEAEPEAPETMTYTRFVLDVGHSGDMLDLWVALMPCVAGYAEIGQLLISDKATVIEGNMYADWIRNYEGEHFLASAQAAIENLDSLGKRRGADARFAELSKIFNTATRLEAAFWQMGLNAGHSKEPIAAE